MDSDDKHVSSEKAHRHKHRDTDERERAGSPFLPAPPFFPFSANHVQNSQTNGNTITADININTYDGLYRRGKYRLRGGDRKNVNALNPGRPPNLKNRQHQHLHRQNYRTLMI